jgi:hypothetical protein
VKIILLDNDLFTFTEYTLIILTNLVYHCRNSFLVGLSRGLSVPAACLVGTATSGLCALGVGSDAGNVDWYLVEKFALAVPSHLEIKSDVESIITGTGSSGEPTAEAGFLSPPPAALAQRLQKLINKVADSDDENTPVRGTIGPTVSVRK